MAVSQTVTINGEGNVSVVVAGDLVLGGSGFAEVVEQGARGARARRPLAARDVYLCAAEHGAGNTDEWRIEYAGRLGDACYEVLSELSGLSAGSRSQGDLSP
jgi:hypothetical protein